MSRWLQKDLLGTDFMKHSMIILLLTGDFGRAKTPTTASVNTSYFPLIIMESVGI